jgi:rhodanese-related sulfurtransferase
METQYFEFLRYLIRFNRYVYLDHNPTTKVSSRVQRKMNQVLKDHYGNPSSFYGIGRKSAEIIEQAPQQVTGAIHTDPHEIYFTAATESNNAVLKSVSAHFFQKRKRSFLLSVERYLDQFPKDKQILVVCPGGGLSFMIAYYLKAKGFKRVSNLRGGFDGWRKRRNDLYQKYAGQNITVLQLGKYTLAVQ